MAKNTNAANSLRPYGFTDKLAYAAADFGCNMSFSLKAYLTIFWTQYMGLDSVVMAGLLLIVQVWDAINDPVIGAIIDNDKRQYKRNKFLTYMWLGSIGLLFAGAACFLPFKSAPAMAKNLMFVGGYIIWDAFYTIANVPYGSMLSLITDEPGQRAELSTWRGVGACTGAIACSALIPMLIYDASNNLKGDTLFITALIMGVAGFIAFQYAIRNTVIRVNTDIKVSEDAPKFNFFKAMGNFMKNRAALGATLGGLAALVGAYGASTAMVVLFQAYFQNAKLSGMVGALTYAGIYIWTPFVAKISNKIGNKAFICLGCAIEIVVYALMMILPITPDTTGMIIYFVLAIVASLGTGILNSIASVLMADAIDYNEWKNGVRDEGTTYALYSFFRKLGQGVFPSLGLILAVWFGYEATLGAAQVAQTAVAMRYLAPGAYLVGGILELICYGLIYNLDKKTCEKMREELAARRG